MRLLLDLQSIQGESRGRGIARHSLGLARALAAHPRGHEVFFALSARFPHAWEDARALSGMLPPERVLLLDLPDGTAWNTRGSAAARRAAEARRASQIATLRPDIVHLTSLFEGLGDSSITGAPVPPPWPRTTATLHDLMPLARPDIFFTIPHERAWYLTKAEEMRRADALLAVSASSAREATVLLDYDPARITVIGAAADPVFHPREVSGGERRRLLSRYGIHKPFIMFTGGDSPQKNIGLLLQAFARLPDRLRRSHQIVLACKIGDPEMNRLRASTHAAGLHPEEWVATGFISDASLASLYNLCSLFIFPSWYEGFGLPVLEAMQCGAPVLASRATSLPEVVGREASLFDPHDAGALAAQMARVLQDEALARELKLHGVERARAFTWEQTARKCWEAFESLAPGTTPPSIHPPPEPAPPPEQLPEIFPSAPPHLRCHPGSLPPLDAFLGSGWWPPERWGTWSCGQRSVIHLKAPPGWTQAADLRLRFKALVLPSCPVLQATADVHGSAVRQFRLVWGSSRRTLRLPLGPPDSDGFWQITLHSHNPRSPSSLGVSKDSRNLGLGLCWLELVPTRPRPAQAALAALFTALPRPLRLRAARNPWNEPLRAALRARAASQRPSPPAPGIQPGAFSVIVCTLNRAALLAETLDALAALTHPAFEIVVVAGPSQDGTAALLDRWTGRIKRITCPLANLSRARNLGLSAAAGEFTAFLDDDAIPDPSWLEELEAAFADPAVGAAGGRVLDRTGLAYQYEYASSDRLGRSDWKRTSPCPGWNYPGSYHFPYLQGTNSAFRRSALASVGGFDEAFAYYLDETEACLRINDAGWVIRQLAGARVIHRNATSDLRRDDLIQDHTSILASKFYFALRHGPLFHSSREIEEECARFTQDHRNGVRHLITQGRMRPEQAEHFEQQAVAAEQRARQAAAHAPVLWHPPVHAPPPLHPLRRSSFSG